MDFCTIVRFNVSNKHVKITKSAVLLNCVHPESVVLCKTQLRRKNLSLYLRYFVLNNENEFTLSIIRTLGLF